MHGLGATVVMVTHDPEVAAVAGRTVRMRNGNIVEDPGGPAHAKEPPAPKARLRRQAWLESLRMGATSVRPRQVPTGPRSAGGADRGAGAGGHRSLSAR